MSLASNFGFLSAHDPKLVQLGAFAERYFRDDPPTCLIKVRQLAELVAKLIAAHHALYAKDRETFEERLRRLHYDLSRATTAGWIAQGFSSEPTRASDKLLPPQQLSRAEGRFEHDHEGGQLRRTFGARQTANGLPV